MSDHTDFDEADLIRTCTRKKGYPGEDVAKMAVISIKRTNPDAGVRPYACRRCGLWHVGGVPWADRPEYDPPVLVEDVDDDDSPRHRKPSRREATYSRRPRRRRREY